MKKRWIPLALFSPLLLLISAGGGEAQETSWARYQNYKIHLDVPEGWQIQRDLFGMPLMVLGPERKGERAVLSVQHTRIRNLRFDFDVLARNRSEYYRGRRNWIEGLEDPGSRYIGDLPLERLTWRNGNEGFQIGFRYRMRGLDFEERSIQLSCGGRLFLFKTLTSSKSPAEDTVVLARLVRGLDCADVSGSEGSYAPSPLQDLKHKVQARVNGEASWPSRDRIRDASPEARAVMLEALVEFQKSFEEAGGPDSWAQIRASGKSASFASLRKGLSRLEALFLASATAREDYDCFFGGWPSKFVRKGGRTTCDYPWEQNEAYSKSGTTCGDGELACNPALFGKGLCIGIGSAGERHRATSRCEEEFVEAGRDYDQVAKSGEFSKDLLSETYASTEKVCKSEPYVSSNYGLCSTLAEKLNIALDPPSDPEGVRSAEGEAYLNGTGSPKPAQIADQGRATLAGMQDFEARCLDEKGQLNGKDESCLSDTAAITADLERLDRDTRLLEDELAAQYAAEADSAVRNENCADCGSKEAAPELAPGVCSAEQKKTMESGKCQWKSPAWYVKVGASCNMNLLTSVVESLWDTIKAIGGLVWDGVASTAKWFASWFGYEDESSKKVNVASQVSNSFLKELVAHPVETVMKMFSAIWDGIQHYLDYDAYCQRWSGVPHFSTCLLPGTDGCTSCTAQFTGTCSVIGYVIGEVLPAIFTGGGSAAASGVGLSTEIGAALGRAAKAGKMGGVLRKVNRVAKLAQKSKAGVVAVKSARKAVAVARWPAKKLKVVKTQLAAAKKTMGAFRSARFGGWRKTLLRMQELRKKHFVVKAGVWTVKWALVKPVQTAGKIAKAVIKAPYTLPKKAMETTLKVQEKAFELGAKYGEKYGNRVLRKTVERTLRDPAAWSRSTPRLEKALALAEEKLTARAVTGVSGSLRWFGTRANLIGNLYQGKEVLNQAVKVDWTDAETIRSLARTEGKSEAEVRRNIEEERKNRQILEGVQRVLLEGLEPTEEDFRRVERFTGNTRDQIRMESIEQRVAAATEGKIPKFTAEDYALFASQNSWSPDEGKKRLDGMVEGKVLEEGVMGALNSGREPDPAKMKSLIRLMNETRAPGDPEVTSDQLRVNSIFNRATGVNGLHPVFQAADYEAWARMNGVSVDEARAQIQAAIEGLTQESSSPR